MMSNVKYTDVRVSSTGQCYWSRYGELSVASKINVQKYPYESANATFTFLSWIHPTNRLQLSFYNPAMRVQDGDY